MGLNSHFDFTYLSYEQITMPQFLQKLYNWVANSSCLTGLLEESNWVIGSGDGI